MAQNPETLLKLQPREEIGSAACRRMRKEGIIPSVIYGLEADAIPASVSFVDLRTAMSTDAGRNAVLTLELGGNKELGIVKDIQWHPYREDVLHVDFLRINPDQDVTVEVPIITTGEPRALNLENGILEQLNFTLTVVTKPHLIPDQLEVDVSEVEVGDTITVADIQLPAGTSTPVDPETAILTGTAARIVELAEEAEEDADEESTEEGEETAKADEEASDE